MTNKLSTFHWLICGVATLLSGAVGATAEAPFSTIVFTSNAYITTLDRETLKTRKGERFWLAGGHTDRGLENAVNVVNALKPDAWVAMGAQSWSGTDADFARCRDILRRSQIPVYLTPGQQDIAVDDDDVPLSNGPARFRQAFAEFKILEPGLTRIGDVALHIPPWPTAVALSTTDYVKHVTTALTNQPAPGAAVLLGGTGFESGSHTPNGQALWALVKRHKIAARLRPGRGHSIVYEGDILPSYAVPSTGWSPRQWTLTIARFYKQRIELSLHMGGGQPEQILTIPNPIATDRWPASAMDPYGLPTYSEDKARKPEFTFVQMADSQLDDLTTSKSARYKYAPVVNRLAVDEVNKLKPAMVFMTGDLVNKNTVAEWRLYKEIFDGLQAPYYPLPGNHDVMLDAAAYSKKTDDAELLRAHIRESEAAVAGHDFPEADHHVALYRQVTGKPRYYSIDQGSSRFICLDTSRQYIDEPQLAWLRQELAASAAFKHVFLLGHHPVLSHFGHHVDPERGGNEVLALMKAHKVAMYLFGHRHNYGYRVHDGTAHVLCDCLCWGEYRSFQIYHVFPDRIVSCWKPIFRKPGNRPLYERVTFVEPRFSKIAKR